MFEVVLEIILASLIGYGAGYVLGGIPIVKVVGLLGLPVAGLVSDGPKYLIVIPFYVLAFLSGIEANNKKTNEAIRKEEARREALEQAGPAVVPLSEDELRGLISSVYSQYLVWTDSKYDHTWVVIAFEAESIRFSAVGKYPPYTGFTQYYPYSHRVFGSTSGMGYDDMNARFEAHTQYRRQIAQRVLSYLRENDVTRTAEQLWIDPSGDILSSSQH